MAQFATVAAINGNGTVFAVNAAGVSRALKVGDELQKGETIRTVGDIRVELMMEDGRLLAVAPAQSVRLDDNVVDSDSRPTTQDSAVATPATADTIIQALERGTDLNQTLDATAAGPGTGGGTDGGSTFVQLLRITEGVEPLTYNYSFSATGATGTTQQVLLPTDTTLHLTADAAVSEGSAGITYTATLGNPALTPMTITLNNGAVITIAAGSSVGSVLVPVHGEDVYVNAGPVTATVVSVSGGGFSDIVVNDSNVITVVNDTITPITVDLSASTGVAEGSAAAYTFTATLSAVSHGDTTVVTDKGTIVIHDGQTSGTLVVAGANGEDVYKDASALHATITSASGGNFEQINIGNGSATATIVDTVDAVTVNLSASTSVLESGTAAYTFTATLSAVSHGDTTVVTDKGTITIADGQTTGTLVVASSNGEDVYKDASSLQASITSASGGNFEQINIGNASATASINDTINVVTVGIAGDASVAEGAAASYTLTLTAPGQTDVVVNLSYSGTATDGSDFGGIASVTIPAGSSSASFNITTLNDALIEGNESFNIQIAGASGGNFESLQVNGSASSVSTTIVDNDFVPDPVATSGTVEEAGLPGGTAAASARETTGGDLVLQPGWTVQTAQSGTSAHGSWSVGTDGTYSYTLSGPTSDGTPGAGSDSFSYTVKDTQGNTVNNTLNITIVDDVPTAVADAGAASEGQTTTVVADATHGLLSNDTVGADTGAGVVVTSTGAHTLAHGTLTISADGGYSYVANASVPAGTTDSFTYTMKDADGDTSTATLTLTFAGDHNAPTASNGTAAQSDAALSTQVADTGSLSFGLGADTPVTVAMSYDAGLGAAVQSGVGSGTVTFTASNWVLTVNETTGAYSFHQTGAYTHDAGASTDSGVVTVTLTDSDLSVKTATLTLNIGDMGPTAVAITQDGHGTAGANTNLLIVLDISGSMDTASGVGSLSRLDMAKQSITDLFAQYDNLGDVKVRLVTFSDSAQTYSSTWTDIATAATTIASLHTVGSTNYDAALNMAWNAFGDAGKLTGSGVQNVSYFLSDGQPNQNSVTGTGTVHGSLGGGNGIDLTEESDWVGFLNANHIASFALGMGTGAVQSALDPIAYNGMGTGAAMDATVVTDFSQLSATLISTISALPIEGNLVDAATLPGPGSFGADGGHVQSIAVDGTTYTYDPTAGGSIAHTGGVDKGTFATSTNELTVTLDAGGKIAFNMDTGHYLYTPPATINNVISANINFVLVDNDGDTASSTLHIAINLPDATNVAPVTLAGAGSGNEDAAVISVVLSGTDSDGSVASFKITSLPTNGALFSDAAHTTPIAVDDAVSASSNAATVYFVPNANFNGSPTFQYVAIDNTGAVDATPATATITVNSVNDAPVIGNMGGTLAYTENAAATVINGGVTVADVDSVNFNTGSLRVAFTANGTSADQLGIHSVGTADGQISVSGSTISYNAVGGTANTQIGTFAGGTNGTDLVVTFTNNAATPEAVQALLQNITYSNTSNTPSTLDRIVTFSLNDGDGTANGGNNTGTALATIQVSAVYDGPLAVADFVFTNAGATAFNIPEWALLANDSGDSPSLDVNAISSVSSGNTAVHTPGTGDTGYVQFTDGSSNGGTFAYAAKDDSTVSAVNALVTVSQDSNSIGGHSGDNILINVDNNNNRSITGDVGNDVLIDQSNRGNTLNGGGGNDILYGGVGDDTLTGGAGADVFKWSLADAAVAGTNDKVTDFNLAQGDVLDLKDLLNVQTHDAATLDHYLTFTKSGTSDTLVTVHADGSSAVTQTITLQNVDLVTGHGTNVEIIQSLLNSHNLKTDV